MKHIFTASLVFVFFMFSGIRVNAQTHDVPIHPSIIKTGKFLGVTPPLRDIPPLTPAEIERANQIALEKAARKKEKELRHYPFASTALPKGPDAAWQNVMGETHQPMAPIQNFEGQTTSSYPPDCNGTVGPNHFFQTVNVTYSIYNKTGTLLAGPTALNTLFTGVPGATSNDGDPIVLYDDQAQRWLVCEFTFNLSNDYMLMAVSQTSDPTGSWYKYSFDVTNDPDYPKFGVWQDGYYMGINSSSGNDIYVFERSKMLLGQTAQMIGFDNAWRPGPSSDFECAPPLDNDGPAAPTGAPGLFIAFNDDAVGGGADELWVYELTANWTTPASSTFVRSQQLGVTAFDSQFTSTWDDITQPTSQKLDGVPQVIMNVPQYRNFGTYQTIVCCHTVDVDATNHAGVRWYELRKTPPATTWVVRQQGTYAPDSHSRWMGSIMLNGNGKIGLGYSISSSTVYPGIRYTGQSASAYANATGLMDITEEVIYTGAYAQSGYNRWGDYANMSVDPTDDQTFWFSTEYVKSGGSSKGSRIASFKFGNSPTATTQDATAITGTGATINGIINPNGLATNYYFQWGTTTSYGNTTTTTAAGSGTANINVNATLSGLTGGTTYHFRVVGVNSDGTTNGSDLTFTPGAAVVTTTAVTGITGSTATSGGTVTSDGGAGVTARGVCWSTSANPVVSGSHTTDGSGTGTFISSITGLTSNTTYYVRAYATNANGTYYGTQVSFTTICGIFSLPFTENFGTSTLPSCWTKQQTSTATDKWTVSNTANAGGTAYEMKSTYQNVSSATIRLVTPPLNTIGVTQLNLSFRHMLDAYGTGCTLRIQSSADGVTWTNEAWSVASTSSNINATTVNTTVLSNLNSASTYIAFAIEGNLFQYDYWYIDNVSVVNNCSTTYPVSVTIAASANPVCAGTSVTFTATPTNGGSSPAYQWKVNGTNVGTSSTTYSYTPANGDVVTCVLTSNLACATGNPATSNSVTMTVNALSPVSVSVTPSANPSCAGTSVTFTANPTNGGSSPAYQWYKNSVAVGTGATYSYIPSNGDQVYVVMTSNLSCTSGNPATSGIVAMTVNPIQAVSVTASPSANPVCAGTSVTFTATPTNGGTTPSYQWYKNSVAVGTGASYSYVPSNGDQVWVVMTSSLTCTSGNPATSATTTMTVNPLLAVSVTASPSANPVCAGTSVTFTANPTNGGPTPTYQWYKNSVAVGTGTTYSYVPANGDQVWVVLTSSLTCTSGNPATSVSTTMTVNPLLAVSVTASPSANPVCAGTSVTFTANPTNGGSSPSYQWYKNSIAVGTGATYSYIPANGDQVWVVLASSLNCTSGNPATSATTTMTVNPLLPVSVSVTPSANPICAGAYVTFTATPGNGGATPSYQWKVNGTNAGSNSPTYSYYPVNNDVVTCVLTSNATCASGSPATSGPVTMTVNPNIPVSVSISPSATNICQGTPVTFTAYPINGGVSPTYQWYKNSVAAGTGATYACVPSNGDQVWVVMTSSLTCTSGSPATSNTVTMTVNPLLPVSISVVPSANPVCAGTSVIFTAIPVNGGNNPDFQWKVNGNNVGNNSLIYTFIPVDGDVIACELTSDATCATGSPALSPVVTMTVNPELPVSVTVVPSENPVIEGTPVIFTAIVVNGGTNPTYAWYVNGVYTGMSGSTCTLVPANNDQVACMVTSNALCATGNPAMSPPVTMIVNVSSSKSLSLKVYMEGLYDDAGVMRQARDESGPHFSAGIADQVTIELHNSLNYSVIEYSSGPVNVSTGGIVSINGIPTTYSESYYITVRHRNSIETTSALPVSFTGTSISYDFSTSSSQAYGNNLTVRNGVYLIYSGDVNQDGVIDATDMAGLETAADTFVTGYVATDVNGDGIVDLSDMLPVDYNIGLSVSAVHP